MHDTNLIMLVWCFLGFVSLLDQALHIICRQIRASSSQLCITVCRPSCRWFTALWSLSYPTESFQSLKRQQAASVIFTKPFGVLGELVFIWAVNEVTAVPCMLCSGHWGNGSSIHVFSQQRETFCTSDAACFMGWNVWHWNEAYVPVNSVIIYHRRLTGFKFTFKLYSTRLCTHRKRAKINSEQYT